MLKKFIFESFRKILFDASAHSKLAGRKVVLITHHGVSRQSIHAKYAGDALNSSFMSELFSEILVAQPDLIVHGHTHNCFDYTIDKTRIIVNPRGYPRENPQWNECLTISL